MYIHNVYVLAVDVVQVHVMRVACAYALHVCCAFVSRMEAALGELDMDEDATGTRARRHHMSNDSVAECVVAVMLLVLAQRLQQCAVSPNIIFANIKLMYFITKASTTLPTYIKRCVCHRQCLYDLRWDRVASNIE